MRKYKPHNWLVLSIHDEMLEEVLRVYDLGILLDIGCGAKPYKSMLEGVCDQHIGLDYPHSLHVTNDLDILALAQDICLADNSIDTILCTFVLEHLEFPQESINEFYRVVKPGGILILSAPLFWHLHEEPRDFYRYTKYGLTHLLQTAGFRIIDIKPLAGFVVTFCQEFVYFLEIFKKGILKFPILALQWVIQFLGNIMNSLDRSYKFTWAYLVIAQKENDSK